MMRLDATKISTMLNWMEFRVWVMRHVHRTRRDVLTGKECV